MFAIQINLKMTATERDCNVCSTGFRGPARLSGDNENKTKKQHQLLPKGLSTVGSMENDGHDDSNA